MKCGKEFLLLPRACADNGRLPGKLEGEVDERRVRDGRNLERCPVGI